MTQPRLVGGRYELGELIGYGGMAEVHRGRDTRLNRDVAIKVLRADLARDQTFLTRFRREAHSAAGLNHPAIVAVFDTGEDIGPDGTAVPFIVMEFVEGRTLRDIVKAEGQLPARRAMEIAADICSALDFSHRNGIVHRDIKPANVMITRAGAVKVMDFGIARAVADTSATMTQTANVIGTAQYLSPEQARGESVDARSDVYSTGCLLYELVTGVPPFQGDSPVAVAYQHVREVPAPPSSRNPEVPRVLDSVIMKALAKNPLNRYQSAGDMRADLQRALADQRVQAEAVMTDEERTQFISRTPPPPPPIRASDYDEDSQRRRRNGIIWAAVVVALLLVIGIGSFLLFNSSDSGPTMVAVGNVIGKTSTAAEAELRHEGFVPKLGDPTSGACSGDQQVPAGRVCVTRPSPAVKAQKGSIVVYQVYEQALVRVPFVQDLTLSQAVAALRQANLNYSQTPVYSFDPKGQVEKQSISANETVKPGTSVALGVSTGTEKLPDVRGMSLGDAQASIPNGFTDVKVQYVDTADESKNNIVMAESPSPKQAYAADQRIQLTVYRYVAPVTCTPSSPSTSPTTGSTSSSPSGGTTSSTPSSGTSSSC